MTFTEAAAHGEVRLERLDVEEELPLSSTEPRA
jgi:hypothetical protein